MNYFFTGKKFIPLDKPFSFGWYTYDDGSRYVHLFIDGYNHMLYDERIYKKNFKLEPKDFEMRVIELINENTVVIPVNWIVNWWILENKQK